MTITVSTIAFDAVLESRPGLTVWLSRGFVSGDVCGFELFVIATSQDPAVLSRMSDEIMWWGQDSPESSLQLELLADGRPVPITLAASGSSAGEGEGRMVARLNVEFPPPAAARLTLTSSSPAWGLHAEADLDSAELARSLKRWEESTRTA